MDRMLATRSSIDRIAEWATKRVIHAQKAMAPAREALDFEDPNPLIRLLMAASVKLADLVDTPFISDPHPCWFGDTDEYPALAAFIADSPLGSFDDRSLPLQAIDEADGELDDAVICYRRFRLAEGRAHVSRAGRLLVALLMAEMLIRDTQDGS